jgi:alginate O-acetyltransferase complex protein AlgI
MLFNSTVFLYGFLPVVYLVFWCLRTRARRHAWLAVTGYVFYGAWDWRFCFLMLLSTVVSYAAGLALLAAEGNERRRRICCVVPIVLDLGLLGFFKYTNFALGTVRSISEAAGHPLALPSLDIVLPVGISFYTFHTITYVVDSYRRVITPTRDFFEFACYVSLFAQLVAGPIVRFRQIEGDLERLDHANAAEGWERGWTFFAIGLVKKVLVADTLAALINPALEREASYTTLTAWLCMLGYAYQLYFDFSGYSDMAVGLGHLFGLELPKNFDSPYKAIDFSDFWRRWHISLSTVLRDYLYIPLGGGRGSRWFTSRNLFVTMLLGGLWHGANWTFVVWGAYHGVLLALQRAVGEERLGRLPIAARRAGVFLLVVVGWVFFRAESMRMAGRLLLAMFWPCPGGFAGPTPTLVASLVIAGGIAHFAPNAFELKHTWRPVPAIALATLFLAAVLTVGGTAPSPFLYFQF